MKCAVFGCKNSRRSTKRITFFKFPTDNVRRQLWLNAIGRTKVSARANICFEHFMKGDLIEMHGSNPRLAKEAIPILNLKIGKSLRRTITAMDTAPKRKRKNWTKADEIRLLGVWEENINELKKTRRNSHIYARMADHFPGHTSDEVHIKISNFTQRFRTENRSCKSPGAGPSAWKYYAIVERILASTQNGDSADNRDDMDSAENGDFEELPDEFRFKEEVSSDASSNASSSPPTPTPECNVPTVPLDMLPPSLRLPLLFPQSLPGSNDSPASSPPPMKSSTAAARARANRTCIQKEALQIARENQHLLREQIAFSREAIKEQLTMIAHSIELIRESTENSKLFSAKICEISQRQLELEDNFMGFMKEILSNKAKRKRKERT